MLPSGEKTAEEYRNKNDTRGKKGEGGLDRDRPASVLTDVQVRLPGFFAWFISRSWEEAGNKGYRLGRGLRFDDNGNCSGFPKFSND